MKKKLALIALAVAIASPANALTAAQWGVLRGAPANPVIKAACVLQQVCQQCRSFNGAVYSCNCYMTCVQLPN